MLAPEGFAIVLVPLDLERSETYEDPTITDPAERERAFWQADHLRLYGSDFPERLREAGFEVTVDRWVRGLDPGGDPAAWPVCAGGHVRLSTRC